MPQRSLFTAFSGENQPIRMPVQAWLDKQKRRRGGEEEKRRSKEKQAEWPKLSPGFPHVEIQARLRADWMAAG
jgi:hypothetical protein